MKLFLESWLANQSLDAPSAALFQEAFRCYRAEAYRASLVFSYLAFLRAVAHRLAAAEQPTEVPPRLWQTLQGKIRDDRLWEEATVDAVLQVQPVSIFLADEDLRHQLVYWRDRRNDAAHAKSNEISSSHVDCLWMFIRSNLGTLVVNGGKAALLQRFQRLLDPTFTPVGTRPDELVAAMPSSVRPGELRDLLGRVIELIDKTKELPQHGPLVPDILIQTIDSITSLDNQDLIAARTEILRTSKKLLVDLLLLRPALVVHHAGDADILHDLWHDLLPLDPGEPAALFILGPEEKRADDRFSPRNCSLRVFVLMLRHELIPPALQEVAMARIVDRLGAEEGYDFGWPGSLLDDLSAFGFFEAVHSRATSHDDWLINHLQLAVKYMRRFPIDRDLAWSFSRLVPWGSQGEPYGSSVIGPEEMVDLHHFFRSQPDKRAELRVKLPESSAFCRYLDRLDEERDSDS